MPGGRGQRLLELVSTLRPQIQRIEPWLYEWEVDLGAGTASTDRDNAEELYVFSAIVDRSSSDQVTIEIGFSRQGSLARVPVGGKQALRVFAAASSFTERIVRHVHPDRVMFRTTMEERERLPLYKALAFKLAKKYHGTRVKGERIGSSFLFTIFLRKREA